MTKRRAVLERPGIRSGVIASFLEGQSDADIARKFSVSRQAIGAFRRRHGVELAQVTAEVERQVTDFAIASKVHRIAELEWLERQTRAYLEQEGFVGEEQTRHGTRRTFQAEAAAALRQTLRQVAEELDQLPRAGINVNNQNVVIVRQVVGLPEGGPPLG